MLDRRVAALSRELDGARQFADMLGDPNHEYTARLNICYLRERLRAALKFEDEIFALVSRAEDEHYAAAKKAKK
jgi:sensor histidine kinase regulating citrate/malate metabolism